MGLLETFEQNCQNAAKTAEGRLLSLVHDNEDTEYGQKYGFSSIKSLQDYKSVVPLTDFDDYATDVDRMLHGEKNVLTAYPIAFYARTTGTAGSSKLIPVSDRGAKVDFIYSALGHEAYDVYSVDHPKTMPKSPKSLLLATATAEYAPDGTLVSTFTGKLFLETKQAISRAAVRPELVFSHDVMDRTYLQAFYALKERDIINIAAAFMSTVGDLLCYIEKNWERLCQDIEDGVLRPDGSMSRALIEQFSAELTPDPERAEELRAIFTKGFERPVVGEIWPSLRYVAAVGAGSFEPYTRIVQRFTGDEVPLYQSIYGASEGLFAAAVEVNKFEYVLIPEAGHFEFIPEDEMDLPEDELRKRTLEMNELCPGKKYEMVVTNLSGLYRYRIGDVITVNGYQGEAPIICFSYRRNQVLSIAGEKTTEQMIQRAIDRLKKRSGVGIVEWSAFADYSMSPARYVMFVEPEGEVGDKEELRDILEEELCDVHEFYAHFIDAGVLAPMKLILLQPQTYALYRDIRIWNGANPNQLKPVHVINNPRKEAFFQALKMYS